MLPLFGELFGRWEEKAAFWKRLKNSTILCSAAALVLLFYLFERGVMLTRSERLGEDLLTACPLSFKAIGLYVCVMCPGSPSKKQP